MRPLRRWPCLLGVVGFCVMVSALPARAQIGSALANYDGVNALGYTTPLRESLMSGLGGGLFPGGPRLDEESLRVRVSMHSVSVFLRDEDKLFTAVDPVGVARQQPQSGATGAQVQVRTSREVEAPSIFGSAQAQVFVNQLGTGPSAEPYGTALLPGGLDLDQLSWNVPQINVGWKNYEAVLRYSSISSGQSEIGALDVFGIGARADLTDVIDDVLPINVFAAVTYQDFEYADGLMGGDLWSVGAFFGKRVRWFHAYSGVTLDHIDFELDYDGFDGSRVTVSETQTLPRLMVGTGLELPYVQVEAELHYNSIFSLALGLSLGL